MNDEFDSHPSEARLVAYLDGELGSDERAVLSRHLMECVGCARALGELRRSSRAFSEAVDGLRPPSTRLTADALRRRAEGGDAERSADEEQARFGWSTATRIAASVAVLLGAAAALPGSPVREWLDQSVQQIQAVLGGGDEAPDPGEIVAPPAPDRTGITDRSGVAVSASGGSILITLSEVPADTEIRVRLVGGPRAGVWNAGGQYNTAPGRIEVTAPASDALLVELPDLVQRVRLMVNGTLAAVARDGELEVTAPGAESRDGEFTFTPRGTK